MKKLNLICASIATLFAVGAANAGSVVSTATKIAVENFGGSAATQETLPVLGAAISYSMSTITAVNSGSTVYFTVRLTGGKFAGTPAATNFTFGGQACLLAPTAATTNNPSCAVTPSADGSTIKVAVTTAASYTLGLGAFTWTPAAADINAVNATLAAVGGKVTASIGLVTLNPAAIQVTDPQVTIDAPLATGDLAVGAKAITGAVAASAYTGQIDLTASTGAATNFTTAGYAVLGSYKFTNAPAGVKIRSGASDYTLGNGSAGTANTGASVVVTPGATQSFPVGSILTLHSNVTCSGALAGAGNTATVTTVNAAAAKTLVTTAAVADATDYFVCITNPTLPNTATPIQVTIAATVAPAAPADLITPASGLGYNLGYNGSSVDVLTYWPGGLDAFSYKGYLRITNTGTVAANVSFAHVNKDTGALFNAAVIIANLLPGQSKLISSVAIDAVAGVAPSNLESGRARITAPTNGLRVQSLLQTGNSAPIEYRANNGL